MGNKVALFLVCRHKRTWPCRCIFNERPCKRNSSFICVAYGMCGSRIRNAGSAVRMNICVFVAAGKEFSAVISHCFNVNAFVAGSRVTVVNPKESTDFHFFARFLKHLIRIWSYKNNFCRSKLMFIFIAKIDICKTFKRKTVSAVFFTNLKRCTSKFVPGTVNSCWCGNKESH